MCYYKYIPEYTAECTVQENGTCSVDVDECASSPCLHGSSCTDSTSTANGSFPISSYGCACPPGWVNGTCDLSYLTCVVSQPECLPHCVSVVIPLVLC